jgi:uncharacterized membrane protein YqaE (UPF0057 family)
MRRWLLVLFTFLLPPAALLLAFALRSLGTR